LFFFCPDLDESRARGTNLEMVVWDELTYAPEVLARLEVGLRSRRRGLRVSPDGTPKGDRTGVYRRFIGSRNGDGSAVRRAVRNRFLLSGSGFVTSG